MKWHITLAVLALVQPSVARGLKTPRSTAAGLEADNDALRQQNKQLQAMMQVARSEVQRMDRAAKSRNLRHDGAGSDTEEVARLTMQLDKAKAERKSLATTLRQMLGKNSTKIFRAKADKALKTEKDLEQKYSKEKQALEAKLKEAAGKLAEEKEMVQTLQEQNMDLQKAKKDLTAKLSKSEKKEQDLTVDKANLVETMRSLMRDTAKAKKELQVETEKKEKVDKDLTIVEAKLANATKSKKIPKPAVAKKVGNLSPKNSTLKMKHEESMASQIAKLHDMNRYIENAAVAVSEDITDAPEAVVAPTAAPKVSEWASVTKTVDSLQKQEDVFEKNKLLNHVADSAQDVAAAAAATEHKAGLSNWLGLKVKPAEGAIPKDANGLSPIDALDPEAVKQEKTSEAKKAKEAEDDGGDGIEDLLSQAHDQLNAMETPDA
jgi:myosin heavy subunit